ncbi:MAG: YbaN family protein [Neofamilia sp.]
MKNVLYKISGIICVILGGIGIIIPVLPTTPFLLLAAWCFVRSSDKLYDWLMNHPVFGLYIKSYIKYRGVEKRYKIFAITMLWMTIGFSVYLIEKRWVEILLVLIATGVTIHIASLKTLTREELIELEKFEAKEKLKTEVVNNFRKSEN